MNPAFLPSIFSGAVLFFSFLLFGKVRLPSLLRSYALSSLALAGLVFFIDISPVNHEDAGHAWLFAAATIAVKVVFIPWLVLRVAEHSQALFRLSSYLRPAPSSVVAATLLGIAFLVVRQTPLTPSVAAQFPLFVSLSLVLFGLALLIIRRDLFSQMSGFLVMENGIALFGVMTVGALPALIELALFFLVTIVVFIMSTLSRHVQEIYGTSDTASLHDLTD